MNVIYIGSNGFPNGLATIQRQILIAKGLIQNGVMCRVITRFGIRNDKSIQRKGVYDGLVPYICAAPIPYRPKNVFKRNINKILGNVNELILIRKYKKKNQVNVLLGIRSSIIRTFYYRMISILFGFKYIIDVNELLGIEGDDQGNMNHLLFNKYSSKLCDGMILISDYLIRHYKKKKNNLKYVKIPIICDVKGITSINPIVKDDNFLLYCSSISYKESIMFVINSFLKVEGCVKLKLIISGSEHEIQKVEQYISLCSKSHLVSIESDIPYNKLISYYKKAKGLLIPLPETIQHKARFPHKIGEYTSSKSPIISNKWGELSNYFDNTSAYLAEKYDEVEFARLMEECTNSDNADIIKNAYKIALDNFDYNIVSKDIVHLIEEV
ncbi:MAG: glycosyltransferase [Zunongwangia sp.]|uniref:glycosyltransferase n=1 Tax=Zunongwangia sp. TaxID=1965325 RepID=UPI003242CB91